MEHEADVWKVKRSQEYFRNVEIEKEIEMAEKKGGDKRQETEWKGVFNEKMCSWWEKSK